MRLVYLQVDTEGWDESLTGQIFQSLHDELEPIFRRRFGTDTKLIVSNYSLKTISKQDLRQFINQLQEISENLN